MIKLTRLNSKEIHVNLDLIYSMESFPDTTITFTDGNKMTVRETPEEITAKIIEFKAKIIAKSSAIKQE